MSGLTRRSVVAGVLTAAAPRSVWSAEYPQRVVTIIHGFPPGGTLDVVARVVAEELSSRIKQPVIVESKVGGSGIIAASFVARASPDGYILFAIPAGHVILGATFKSVPYRIIDDYSPIGMLSEYPYVLVTPASASLTSFDALVRLGKSRDTPLVYGSPGTGSGPHLAVELLARLTGIKTQHIPYRGASGALIDLLGGRLDFMMDPPGPLLENVANGKLNALAVTGDERFFSLPKVPTVREVGVPNFVVTGWNALLAPAGLPEPVQTRLNAELNDLLNSSSVASRLHALGAVPKPVSPAELKARMEADLATWNKVVVESDFQRM